MNRRQFIFLVPGGAVLAALHPLTLFSYPNNGTQPPSFKDIVTKAFQNATDTLPLGDAIVAIGKEFLGVPYVGNTLDEDTGEHCVIRFDAFDCVTFFEISLDIARILIKKNPAYSALVDEVTFTRYRGGHLTDFTSRLHYTSDWIFDNTQKNVVADITRELGGIPFTKTIDFMTTHVSAYHQLKEQPELVPVIRTVERRVTSRPKYYIPKEHIRDAEPRLHNGDILAFTSAVPGLDCAHTGLALVENGQARLLHASSVAGKVVVSEKTIAEYIAGVSHDTGMMVARPIDVLPAAG